MQIRRRGKSGVGFGLVLGARLAFVLLGLAAMPLEGFATASVARGPTVSGVPTSLEALGVLAGPVQVVNGPVWFAYGANYTTNTEAYADDSTGLLRGAARMNVTANSLGAQPYSFFTTNVTGTATVAGPPGVAQNLVATFEVHGRFSDLAGRPGLALQSTLVVDRSGGGAGLLTSNLSFERAEGSTALQVFTDAFAGPFPGTPYPGAQPIVLSTVVANLRGTARIAFQVMPGETLFLEANVIGSAGPENSATNSLAGSGTVDFLDTGVLRLTLPAGVTLVGAQGALASPSVVVPEPGIVAMLAAGIVAIGSLRRRSSTRVHFRRSQ